nr:hypothetical protein [Tanacetum cinerariifolium]
MKCVTKDSVTSKVLAPGIHSAIAPDIDSSAGCKCPLPSLRAIAATDIPSFMITGHEKEQARLSVSTGKRHCVSTAGRRTDEGPKRKKQKLHVVRLSRCGCLALCRLKAMVILET